MPRLATTRSAKSLQGFASKTEHLAQVYAPFVLPAALSGAADQGGRVAVAANLSAVLGLQVFVQPAQTVANLEVDDALLLPFV
jgi:hypothetical protein